MSKEIEALDAIADVVLAYRPPGKKKKLIKKAKKSTKKIKDSSRSSISISGTSTEAILSTTK
jgi:hypothetical protein